MGPETNSLIDVEYHDNEWTILVHDDNNLFEFLLLQSAQVGLSRSTILKKRIEKPTGRVYDFDDQKIVQYNEEIFYLFFRNKKLKIRCVVKNANTFIKVQNEFGIFNSFLRRFVDGC
jgi:DNA-3-methyladenine glycosylase I